MEDFKDWQDVIEELDANADLMEKKPRWLSEKQVDWIKDLQERYLL